MSMIKRRQRDSLANGALIGLAVGAGLGYVLLGTACEDRSCQSWALVFLGGAAGVGIGAGVDAQIPGKKLLIYRAASSPAAARITISPFLTPRRQGVAVRVVF